MSDKEYKDALTRANELAAKTAVPVTKPPYCKKHKEWLWDGKKCPKCKP